MCQLCSQSFRQKQLLSRHMKVNHTENYEPPKPLKKAHICPHCERSFAFKGNLMRHMETHDPNSRIGEEKLELKLGRMRRVQPDGTVVTSIPNDYIFNEDDVENMIDEEVLRDKDGNIVYDDENDEHIQYVYEELDEEEAAQEFDYYEPVDQKPVIKTEHVVEVHGQQQEYKTVSVKKEVDGAEYMAVAVDDGQDYMVIEVVQDGEEDELEELLSEQLEAEQPKNIESKTTKTSKCTVNRHSIMF